MERDSGGNPAKWVGLWLFNTLIATLGVAINVGLLTYSTQAFTSRAVRIQFVQTPYYPVPILVGVAVGFFSYLRFRGSYRYWVWILPALLMLYSLANWRSSNQAGWSEAVIHFLGPLPYPQNRDQLETSLLLYMSLAYSLGAFAQGLISKHWLLISRDN